MLLAFRGCYKMNQLDPSLKNIFASKFESIVAEALPSIVSAPGVAMVMLLVLESPEESFTLMKAFAEAAGRAS